MVDFLIVGVGGQGMISIGHLVAEACLESGIEFVSAETHGMSQRGGSVIFHFRIGDKKAPIIPKGEADVILSGEPMEALRYIDYLKPDGLVISSDRMIVSPVAIQLGIEYPDIKEIWKNIEKWPSQLYEINSNEMAIELGMQQSENIILLGALIATRKLPITFEKMEEVISNRWPRFKEINISALLKGKKIVTDEIILDNTN